MSLKTKFKMTSIAAATAMALSVAAVPAAQAELSTSAGVSTMNLWRGSNDGGTTMFGDINYSVAGAYAGISIFGLAQYEQDTYIGYGGEVGPVGYDISYWLIDNPDNVTGGETKELDIGLSFGDISFFYGKKMNKDAKYQYMSLGYDMGKFSFLVGVSEDDGVDSDYTHIDVSYALTDAVSVTVSTLDAASGSAEAETNKVLFSYAIPVGK